MEVIDGRDISSFQDGGGREEDGRGLCGDTLPNSVQVVLPFLVGGEGSSVFISLIHRFVVVEVGYSVQGTACVTSEETMYGMYGGGGLVVCVSVDLKKTNGKRTTKRFLP